MYDIVVKNGIIADGSGKKGYVADIAIKDGRIAAICAALEVDADKIIDAEGLMVTPGFIDNHSHSDIGLLGEHRFDNVIEQGITTEIVGQCGATIAPMTYVNLTKLAGQFGFRCESLEPLSENLRVFEDYVAYLESIDLGNNLAFYAGHNTIRAHVLGYENRAPSKKELEEMKNHVRNAMEAGALGVSTGLVYPPGCYADTEELVSLLKVAAQYGGNYCTHMRSEGNTIIESIKEVIEIGEQAGVPVNISHFKLSGKNNWHKLDEVFELIDKARSRGIKVSADIYPYLAAATGLIDAIPNKFAAVGPEKLVENLKSRDFRETVWEELKTGTGFENFIEYCGFEGIMVLSAPFSKDLVSRNVAEIAAERKSDPFDILCDIIVENNGGAISGYFQRDDDQMALQFAQPYVVGGTDGGIESESFPLFHPRHIGTFPKLIRKFVREQKVVTIEEAAYKLSYLPAEMAGMKSKGLIKEGYDADIAIFDLDTLKDQADYIHPKAKNEGMKYVIVNGAIAVQDDRFTGIHAGRLHRRV